MSEVLPDKNGNYSIWQATNRIHSRLVDSEVNAIRDIFSHFEDFVADGLPPFVAETATPKQLGYIAYLCDIPAESQERWYNIAKGIPLLKPHANFIIGRYNANHKPVDMSGSEPFNGYHFSDKEMEFLTAMYLKYSELTPDVIPQEIYFSSIYRSCHTLKKHKNIMPFGSVARSLHAKGVIYWGYEKYGPPFEEEVRLARFHGLNEVYDVPCSYTHDFIQDSEYNIVRVLAQRAKNPLKWKKILKTNFPDEDIL